MAKEIFEFLGKKEGKSKAKESLDKARDKKAQKEKEPIFATPEELAEKEKLLKQLKEAKNPEKQRDIKLELLNLDQRRKQRIAKEKGEVILGELSEKFKLPEQYESQKDILEKANIIEKLPSGELGIIGVDGKEYPFPKHEDIIKRMETKGEILKTKIEQGFTKLLIVPFGMKLDHLIEKYKQVILKHHKAGKLLATKEKPTDPDEKLELDEDHPVWKWDSYNNADVEGKIVYFPKEFSEDNHQGKTKQELLKGELSSGYNVLLIEDLPNIPREGKGKTIGKRPQIDAKGMSIKEYIESGNTTPASKEYLKALQDEAIYQNEQGMTLEDQITYAITHLEQTDQVIDDYKGKGSVSWQVGAWFPASGDVPYACWARVGRQAYLGWDGPGNHSDAFGIRAEVPV